MQQPGGVLGIAMPWADEAAQRRLELEQQLGGALLVPRELVDHLDGVVELEPGRLDVGQGRVGVERLAEPRLREQGSKHGRTRAELDLRRRLDAELMRIREVADAERCESSLAERSIGTIFELELGDLVGEALRVFDDDVAEPVAVRILENVGQAELGELAAVVFRDELALPALEVAADGVEPEVGAVVLEALCLVLDDQDAVILLGLADALGSKQQADAHGDDRKADERAEESLGVPTFELVDLAHGGCRASYPNRTLYTGGKLLATVNQLSPRFSLT
jgi:hypothetical protein